MTNIFLQQWLSPSKKIVMESPANSSPVLTDLYSVEATDPIKKMFFGLLFFFELLCCVGFQWEGLTDMLEPK